MNDIKRNRNATLCYTIEEKEFFVNVNIELSYDEIQEEAESKIKPILLDYITNNRDLDIETNINDYINELVEDNIDEFKIHLLSNCLNIKSEAIDKNTFEALEEFNCFLDRSDESEELIYKAIESEGDIYSAKELLENLACYESWKDYERQLYDDCYKLPEHLTNYIDYAAIAKDLQIESECIEANGMIYIISR